MPSPTAASAPISPRQDHGRVCEDLAPRIIARNAEQFVAMLSLENFNALEEIAHLLRSQANARLLLSGSNCVSIGDWNGSCWLNTRLRGRNPGRLPALALAGPQTGGTHRKRPAADPAAALTTDQPQASNSVITTMATPIDRLMATQVRIVASAAPPAGQSLATTARVRRL